MSLSLFPLTYSFPRLHVQFTHSFVRFFVHLLSFLYLLLPNYNNSLFFSRSFSLTHSFSLFLFLSFSHLSFSFTGSFAVSLLKLWKSIWSFPFPFLRAGDFPYRVETTITDETDGWSTNVRSLSISLVFFLFLLFFSCLFLTLVTSLLCLSSP